MTKEEKRNLLDYAYQVLDSLFSGKEVEEKESTEECGAFVTLRKMGALRGCIGYIKPIAPLYEMIRMLVKDAAFNDYRFHPVMVDEVKDITIEISLLTPFQKINSLDEFVLKRDGLYMSVKGRRALFLPDVATETAWDKKTFLENLSLKAGLRPDAYLDPDAEFEIFQSEVIDESSV